MDDDRDYIELVRQTQLGDRDSFDNLAVPVWSVKATVLYKWSWG